MSGIREVTAVEAMNLVANGAVLLDVRELDEWDRGHAPLAQLLSMSSLQDRLGEVPTGQDLLVVCHAGSRSLRVTKVLTEAGFSAFNVQGGMLAWVEASGQIVASGDGAPRVD